MTAHQLHRRTGILINAVCAAVIVILIVSGPVWDASADDAARASEQGREVVAK
jgi:hypothetical protein